MKKRVTLIATSTLYQSTRVPKDLKALIRGGYSVTFLCWDRSLKIPIVEQYEIGDYPKEIRLKLKAPLGNKVLFFYPIWWFFAFFRLMTTKWDMVYAINFDSIPPAMIAGKLKRKPVIYEILDTYIDTRVLPKVIRKCGISIDKYFMRLASGVILVDEMQIEELGGVPNPKIAITYDSPPDVFHKLHVNQRRNDKFTLFFGGILSSKKLLNLNKVFMAIRNIDGVKIIIAGYGALVEEIKEWSQQMPDKIQFIGGLSHVDILQRITTADLLFNLREPIPLANRYICGTKLLEAMMCGRPILVNKGTSAARKVSEEGCGVVVDANNIEQIQEAIVSLKDNPALCQKLGANGRKAYEQQYSWEIMEQRIITLCQEIINAID